MKHFMAFDRAHIDKVKSGKLAASALIDAR